MRKLAVLLIVLILSLVACNDSTGAEIGNQAYDFEIQDYMGEVVNLSDFQGKTVFLLAWTTT